MSGGKKVVCSVSVFKFENIVSVFVPPSRRSVNGLRQKSGKVNFLGSYMGHFLTYRLLHVFKDFQPQREPGKDAGSHLAHISPAHQQFCRFHVFVSRILPHGAGKKG